MNYNGRLTAFTASTGHEDWSVQLPVEYAFTAPLTAYNGMSTSPDRGRAGQSTPSAADNPPFVPIFLRWSKSLICALTAPDLSLKDSSQRRWFFLNLDMLITEPDNDEIVFDRARRELRHGYIVRASTRECREARGTATDNRPLAGT